MQSSWPIASELYSRTTRSILGGSSGSSERQITVVSRDLWRQPDSSKGDTPHRHTSLYSIRLNVYSDGNEPCRKCCRDAHTHGARANTYVAQAENKHRQHAMLTGLAAYLLLQMPYVSSTKAKDRFRQRKKNRFREVLSARIDLKVTPTEETPKTYVHRPQNTAAMAPQSFSHTAHTHKTPEY